MKILESLKPFSKIQVSTEQDIEKNDEMLLLNMAPETFASLRNDESEETKYEKHARMKQKH